jgi:mono/diheme cytochrome c family protein
VKIQEFLFSSVLAWVVVLGASLYLVPTTAAQESKSSTTRSLDGITIFRHYCASCHGTDGKGSGPTAEALNVKVPDLTEITKMSGGKFPRTRIRNILEGIESPVPHGSQKMPIWGPIFHEIDADQDWGHVRVENVTNYIESLQKKTFIPLSRSN